MSSHLKLLIYSYFFKEKILTRKIEQYQLKKFPSSSGSNYIRPESKIVSSSRSVYENLL